MSSIQNNFPKTATKPAPPKTPQQQLAEQLRQEGQENVAKGEQLIAEGQAKAQEAGEQKEKSLQDMARLSDEFESSTQKEAQAKDSFAQGSAKMQEGIQQEGVAAEKFKAENASYQEEIAKTQEHQGTMGEAQGKIGEALNQEGAAYSKLAENNQKIAENLDGSLQKLKEDSEVVSVIQGAGESMVDQSLGHYGKASEHAEQVNTLNQESLAQTKQSLEAGAEQYEASNQGYMKDSFAQNEAQIADSSAKLGGEYQVESGRLSKISQESKQRQALREANATISEKLGEESAMLADLMAAKAMIDAQAGQKLSSISGYQNQAKDELTKAQQGVDAQKSYESKSSLYQESAQVEQNLAKGEGQFSGFTGASSEKMDVQASTFKGLSEQAKAKSEGYAQEAEAFAGQAAEAKERKEAAQAEVERLAPVIDGEKLKYESELSTGGAVAIGAKIAGEVAKEASDQMLASAQGSQQERQALSQENATALDNAKTQINTQKEQVGTQNEALTQSQESLAKRQELAQGAEQSQAQMSGALTSQDEANKQMGEASDVQRAEASTQREIGQQQEVAKDNLERATDQEQKAQSDVAAGEVFVEQGTAYQELADRAEGKNSDKKA